MIQMIKEGLAMHYGLGVVRERNFQLSSQLGLAECEQRRTQEVSDTQMAKKHAKYWPDTSGKIWCSL